MADAENPSEKYDQAFFLDLAAKGKDAWNAWRRDPANKDVRVTFAGIDFSEAPKDRVDFSGFDFGDHADFSQCNWRGVISEAISKDVTTFEPGQARFTSATFGDHTSFTGAVFGDYANFTGVDFGIFASFTLATFGVDARFDEAAFSYFTRFDGAAFGLFASFAGAAFSDYGIFHGAAFGDLANFSETHFKGHVKLMGWSIEKWTTDIEAKAHEMERGALMALEKRHEDSWARWGCGPDRFLGISFTRARFDGKADFSGRTFERVADFTNARFYYPPDFDTATNAARIDFTGAYIGFARPGRLHWTSKTEVPVSLRALRKIAEETKNHDLERDLYIEERKAERGVYWHQLVEELKKAPEELKKKLEDIDRQQRDVWSNSRHKAWARNAHRLGNAVKIARLAVHGFWIVVMGVYWALADYGRSFARPAAWLVASGLFFYWRYTEVLAPLMAKAPDVEKYKQAVRMLALGNTVPFVGPLTIDPKIKEFLFCAGEIADKCAPIPPEGFQSWVISQNLISITCVFFIGLALRNYFRIK